jgi:hypothetical protein
MGPVADMFKKSISRLFPIAQTLVSHLFKHTLVINPTTKHSFTTPAPPKQSTWVTILPRLASPAPSSAVVSHMLVSTAPSSAVISHMLVSTAPSCASRLPFSHLVEGIYDRNHAPVLNRLRRTTFLPSTTIIF